MKKQQQKRIIISQYLKKMSHDEWWRWWMKRREDEVEKEKHDADSAHANSIYILNIIILYAFIYTYRNFNSRPSIRKYPS